MACRRKKKNLVKSGAGSKKRPRRPVVPHPPRRSIIKTMLRLWLLMWYFTRPDLPRENNVPSWHNDTISRSHLWMHLALEKHFARDWRLAIRDWWYYRILKRPLTSPTEFGLKLTRAQRRTIYDLIEKAIHDGYIEPSHHSNSSEVLLKVTWKGRKLVYNPAFFLDAILKEYGYLSSFIFGAGGVSIIWLIKHFLF